MGGWKLVTIEPGDNVPEGISTNLTQTTESAQREQDSKHPRIDTLFYNALKEAKVRNMAQRETLP